MRRVVVALVLSAVLLGGCGSDGSTPQSSVSEGTPEPTATVASTLVDIEIKDGAIVGGMERVDVPLGNEVRLSVLSDVADEVHVHGYDEKREVAEGGGIVMAFLADVPGVFIVELEDAGLTLAELEVR